MAFHPDCEERPSETDDQTLSNGHRPAAARRANRAAEQPARAARLNEIVWRHYQPQTARPGDDSAE